MGSAERDGDAAERLKRLRRRIDRWRWTRRTRGAMPADLWTEATELGRELGAYRVARGLGIGYRSLRDRLGDRGVAESKRAPAFVEVNTGSLVAFTPTANRGEVELSDASGVKLVIRLGTGDSVDVAALVSAFRTSI